MPIEPVVLVLVASGLAAAVSAFGALPFAAGGARPRLVGSAEALASGLMLGSGYLLMTSGLDRGEPGALLGAALGVAYTYLVQRNADTLELASEPATDPAYGYRVILRGALHSASEGVAIGVAMLLELRLGIFVAGALALHNVAEGIVISDLLRRTGSRGTEAAGLAVVSKVTQPLLALAIFALQPVLSDFLSFALGFAAGCLVFLVLTELLPDSYRHVPTEVIASLVTLSAGAVVLAENFFVS